LDAAIHEKGQWERAVTDTRSAMSAAQQRMAYLANDLQELMQQFARSSDKLATDDSIHGEFNRLATESAGLKTLRNRQRRQQDAVTKQAGLLKEIQMKLDLQMENLRQVGSKVQELEKLRARQRQVFEDELERAEQDEIDEAAIQRFNRD
jgi:flagellar biosynthesis chaperone FliJ